MIYKALNRKLKTEQQYCHYKLGWNQMTLEGLAVHSHFSHIQIKTWYNIIVWFSNCVIIMMCVIPKSNIKIRYVLTKIPTRNHVKLYCQLSRYYPELFDYSCLRLHVNAYRFFSTHTKIWPPLWYKIEKKTKHATPTVPKYNRKIAETDEIDTQKTYQRSLSWPGTDILIKHVPGLIKM